MKKVVTLIAPAALLMLAGCANEDSPGLCQGEGAVSVSLITDGTVTDAIPVTRASQASVVPDAADLALSIVKSDGSYSKSWNSIAEFPAELPLTVGAYSMTASWGNPDDEGFEKPYYEGKADVNVEEGKTSEVSITAALANTMVSISYTESFRNYFSQYSTQLHSAGGDFITFLSDEERPAYLRPGNVTVTLSITKQNGVSATIQPAEFEALARHHYHVTLDVNSGNNGEAQLAVIFDDSVVSEDVTVDLSDDVLSAPEPVVTPQGFTPGTAYETLELSAAPSPLRMMLSAAGGLRSVTLTTQSDALIAKGFPAEIDLMAANESQQALLRTLGLDVVGLWKNPDKMASVDFSGVFKNIAGEGTHTFAVVVKDKIGKVNLPVILTATTHAVDLSIKSAPAASIDATVAEMNVSCNAADISGVTVETYSFGAWSEARIISSAAAVSSRHRAPGVAKDYTLRFNIPADPADLQVRLKFKGTVKATGTIEKTGAILTLESDSRVFATHATFKVAHNPKVSIDKLHYFAATGTGSYAVMSNVTFDTAADRVTIKGLSPGTTYTVKASETTNPAGALTPARITTEAALQLPNTGMEDWCVTESGRNWQLRYPAASADACVWGTNNPMTTSQGADTNYTRVSGTKPVEGRSGQAACITTQGWGSGNSAVGTVEGMAVLKYIDAGLLHLGASRTTRPAGFSEISGSLNTDDLDCGLAFASRPSAVNFYYHYTPKNSADHGVAIAKVYDSLGREIASGELELGNQSTWTMRSIPLTYAANAPKAAKIYVCFMSTNVPDALTKSNAWLNPPKFMIGGEYYGSQLYIDDISLSY